jgi:predicted PurR-regulated permease PerM
MDPIIPPPSLADRSGTPAQHSALLVLSLGLLLLGLFTLRHFLDALVWAGIFAIALWPLYCRAVARFGTGRHNVLLPALFTLGVALLFVVPLGLVGAQLAQEARAGADWLRGAQQNGIPEPDLLRHLPFGQTQLDAWWGRNLADPGSARELVQRTTNGHASSMGRMIGAQVVHRLTVFVFTLLTLFFLFRDGLTLTAQMKRAAVRAFGPSGERVGRQIIASVHGTVDGLVLVGLAEGVILGVIYALVGVPHATVFGTLTAVAAMIPGFALVIIGLAALVKLAMGSAVGAVIIFGVGGVVVFAADHFIRPVLIGGATKLPFLWVLLGILGGVEMWGLIGLFLGPAIMAALILLWREWTAPKEGQGSALDPLGSGDPKPHFT